ncbi:MAG: helix-turn-helix transcriptional regulator [Eubacteriales bacterium]|nr:helix-turn-helix transcriptional regulator [Eubacteriales bacterium]
MDVADRIQLLRKTRGISQEELAERVGVSRQAVSKWESGQSMPDIEKILLMSEDFGVTTDYLLKGVEAADHRPDAGIFSIVGTAFNFIGLIVAVMVWREEQVSTSVAIGLILMAVGCVCYAVGQRIGAEGTKAGARKQFRLINVWLLTLMPLAVCFNMLDGLLGGYAGMIAPYPLPGNSLVTYGLCWLLYVGGCIAADVRMLRRAKK